MSDQPASSPSGTGATTAPHSIVGQGDADHGPVPPLTRTRSADAPRIISVDISHLVREALAREDPLHG